MHLHLCCYNNKMASVHCADSPGLDQSNRPKTEKKKVTCSYDITIQNKQSDGGYRALQQCNIIYTASVVDKLLRYFT